MNNVYHVLSRDKLYEVNLNHYDGFGSCTCMDFIKKKAHRIEERLAMKMEISTDFRCKHIRSIIKSIHDSSPRIS